MSGLSTIHHPTISDRQPTHRLQAELLDAGGLAIAHLEYPTSGAPNRKTDDIIDEYAAFAQRYLVEHPQVSVTFVGFSQGDCVELDLLVRLARREPALLDRSGTLLLAPAQTVKLGKSTAVAPRMFDRCEAAEGELEAMLFAHSSADRRRRGIRQRATGSGARTRGRRLTGYTSPACARGSPPSACSINPSSATCRGPDGRTKPRQASKSTTATRSRWPAP